MLVDPGHGGYDPGTSGVAGTLEKDVTLASALALKAVLEEAGRYRVELTRSGDQYVSLEDRVRLAQELGASLVLSMHADEVSDPSVRGASVYTLAKSASDAETAALADRENRPVPGHGGHSATMSRRRCRRFWPVWPRARQGSPLPASPISWCTISAAACRCCRDRSGTRISSFCMRPISPAC